MIIHVWEKSGCYALKQKHQNNMNRVQSGEQKEMDMESIKITFLYKAVRLVSSKGR